ncbi:hypothetical protein AC629_40370 [Bradyrhizobium sp. NAS80.1]|uniref:hypothetical protein n=1 Tax=Bradyrhizobium sp. NAS80.1 TaxID=1680159 RepID=UPI00096223A7|nr:hypothetical protein [Bradyrhizobium sp. NAS80.1]OKO70475.1 hypothetical protein AC629_40370 [Bradyrhizobium sp. NAS80.1]
MIIARIAGATRVIGQSQGYLGLPLRDELREVSIGGETVRCRAMVTAWEPTPDEVERIKSGAPIYLCVLGIAHPPVMLDVGEVPE